jgi:hypothetical protein
MNVAARIPQPDLPNIQAERFKKPTRAQNQKSVPVVPASTTAATPLPAAFAASTATAAPRGWRARFIHHQGAAHECLAVQGRDGAFRFFVVLNLNKTEPPRLPGSSVAQNRN